MGSLFHIQHTVFPFWSVKLNGGRHFVLINCLHWLDIDTIISHSIWNKCEEIGCGLVILCELIGSSSEKTDIVKRCYIDRILYVMCTAAVECQMHHSDIETRQCFVCCCIMYARWILHLSINSTQTLRTLLQL